jgi:hypothetical protein
MSTMSQILRPYLNFVLQNIRATNVRETINRHLSRPAFLNMKLSMPSVHIALLAIVLAPAALASPAPFVVPALLDPRARVCCDVDCSCLAASYTICEKICVRTPMPSEYVCGLMFVLIKDVLKI